MRYFDDWIAAYLEYCRFSESPDKFHRWTAVGTVAGALRRQVWLDMGYFQWTPNFYIIFVAPPGIVSKSTTINIGMNLLRELEDIHFGPDAVTWQALARALAESRQAFEVEPEVFHVQSAITIASSELGTFFNPHDREMVDMLVSLWDGQPGVWRKLTKTSGEDLIENPWINLLACTTPAWIAGNFPEYLVGGGFTSRCIWVYGQAKRKLVAYPGLAEPDSAREELRRKLVHDLEQIASIRGPYELTPDAVAFGEAWYEHHHNEVIAKASPDDRRAGYWARKQTHLHKLAMVISAARRGDRRIIAEDLETALSWLEGAEEDALAAFRLIGMGPSQRLMQMIADLVQRRKRVPLSQLVDVIRASGVDPHDVEGVIRLGSNMSLWQMRQVGNEICLEAVGEG